jgi:alkylated DNA nucleotide flippase Atl1
MEEKVQNIIKYLNKVKTRCTYGAVAEILGVKSRSVGLYLGQRRPDVSWVVNAKTGEPTDYEEAEKHPELYRTNHIIKSAEVLRRNIGV